MLPPVLLWETLCKGITLLVVYRHIMASFNKYVPLKAAFSNDSGWRFSAWAPELGSQSERSHRLAYLWFCTALLGTQLCWREELPSSPRDLMGHGWDPAPALSTGKLAPRGAGFKAGRVRWSPTEASTTLGRADKYLTFRATLIRHQEEMKGFIPIKILLYLL